MNFKSIFRTAVLLSALCADSAFADVTINVKATSAPNLYVWDTADTKYNGDWPGAVMSDTKVHDGVTYWTKTFTGVSSVNIIISENGNNKSGTIPDVTKSDAYFEYDNGKAWGTMPPEVVYDAAGYTVYYVDIYRWGKARAHVWNGNYSTAWPGDAMTKVGTDLAGFDVYKHTFSAKPDNIQFTDDGTNQTNDGTFVNHGYYLNLGNTTENWWFFDAYQTIGTDRLAITASNFPDANFRAALGTALGITLGSNNENASQAFSASDIEVLDVTDKGITSLSGIEHFTGLKELYAGQNSILGIDLGDLTSLEVLDLHGTTKPDPTADPALVGFTATRSSASTTSGLVYVAQPHRCVTLT